MGRYDKKDLASAAVIGFLCGSAFMVFVWLLCVMF